MGKADNNCKFRAAEPKVPILITNVHKDTSKSDITEYIREKTKDNISLDQIVMKNKNSNHNAYKFYVCKNKVNMFLDEKLWPSGVIFRRFITSSYKPTENNDYASTSQAAVSATVDATIATHATTSSNNKAVNGNK